MPNTIAPSGGFKQVNDISGANAYLSYIGPQGRKTFLLWVMEYEQTHELRGNQYQSRNFTHWYSRFYNPGKIAVRGRLPNVDQRYHLGDFIRAHQQLMVSQNGSANIPVYNGLEDQPLSLMFFGIPIENYFVQGFINTFNVEEKVFNPAPSYDFEFEPIKDRHSTNLQIVPSHALRNWWTGAIVGINDPSNDTTVAPPDWSSFDDNVIDGKTRGN